MAAYISQSEATTYTDVIGTWTAAAAVAYLSAASSLVDQYCARSFLPADLTADVKLAIALTAVHLKTNGQNPAPIQMERIGDYSAMYQILNTGSVLPALVTQLLQPYRNVVMG
jgi:hypothetical protein